MCPRGYPAGHLSQEAKGPARVVHVLREYPTEVSLMNDKKEKPNKVNFFLFPQDHEDLRVALEGTGSGLGVWQPRAMQKEDVLRLLQAQLLSNLLRSLKQVSLCDRQTKAFWGHLSLTFPKGQTLNSRPGGSSLLRKQPLHKGPVTTPGNANHMSGY